MEKVENFVEKMTSKMSAVCEAIVSKRTSTPNAID